MLAAEAKMLEAAQTDLKERFGDFPKERIRIGISGTFTNKDAEQEWIKKVKDTFPGYETDFAPLSCSIACHVSVDTAGVAVTVVEEK